MKGAVLAVGDELLLGDIVNSNAAWLGQQLAAVGVHVVHSAMVGDDVAQLSTALRRAVEDADIVVVTGGLGPTIDDLTREAIALVAGAPLQRQPGIEVELRAKFAAYGFPMQPAVLAQADVPRGAEALDNPVGTAPGLWLELADGTVLLALPGPPHEMRAVVEAVLPRLAERSGTRVVTRTLRCSGLGESAVAELVQGAVVVPDGVALAYLAGGAVVRVRFTTSGDPALLEPLVEACAVALGDAVWGYDEQSQDGVVHDLLAARGETVAVAESLTGGLLSAALSQRPGSSATFRGGLVPYATDLKGALAGVAPEVLAEHGAVAPPTAAALATGARDRLGATWGLGVTGVAGPDEQEGKAVGTVHLAVAGPDGVEVSTVRLPGDRDRVRLLTVTTALDLLRRRLSPGKSGG